MKISLLPFMLIILVLNYVLLTFIAEKKTVYQRSSLHEHDWPVHIAISFDWSAQMIV